MNAYDQVDSSTPPASPVQHTRSIVVNDNPTPSEEDGGYNLLLDTPSKVRRRSLISSSSLRRGARDWNKEYYNIKEMSFKTTKERLRRSKLMMEWQVSFHRFARTYAQIIVHELAQKEKLTIAPKTNQVGGFAGGLKYIVGNMLFKVAVDEFDLYDGDHEMAGKIAKCELKSSAVLHQTRVRKLCPPLSVLVDYLGIRILCSAVVPIKGDASLQLGSRDGGSTVRGRESCRDTDLSDLAFEAARRLNLKPHIAGLNEDNVDTVPFAADVEAHLGLDGRYYVLDLARLMPPEHYRATSHLLVPSGRAGWSTRRLRADFVRQWSTPLDADALSNFGKHNPDQSESGAELRRATKSLIDERLSVCAQDLLRTFSSLGSGTSLVYGSSHRSRMTFVAHEIHRFGIGLRHMGFIRRRVATDDDEESSPLKNSVVSTLLGTMISRTLKNVLRMRLRSIVLATTRTKCFDETHVIADVLTMVVQCGRRGHFKMAQSLTKQVRKRFGQCAVTDAREVATLLADGSWLVSIIETVADMVGVAIRAASMEEFRHRPHDFVFMSPDIEEVRARVVRQSNMDVASGLHAVLLARCGDSTVSIRLRLMDIALRHFRTALQKSPNDRTSFCFFYFLIVYVYPLCVCVCVCMTPSCNIDDVSRDERSNYLDSHCGTHAQASGYDPSRSVAKRGCEQDRRRGERARQASQPKFSNRWRSRRSGAIDAAGTFSSRGSL